MNAARRLLALTTSLVLLSAGAAWAAWTDTQSLVGARSAAYAIPPTALSCRVQGNSAFIEWTGQTVPVPLLYDVFLNGSTTPTEVAPSAGGTYSVRFNFGIIGSSTQSVRVVARIDRSSWAGPSTSRTATRGLVGSPSCGPQT